MFRFMHVVQEQLCRCALSVFRISCTRKDRGGEERIDRNLQISLRLWRDFLFQWICLGTLEQSMPGNTSGRTLILMIGLWGRFSETNSLKRLWPEDRTEIQGQVTLDSHVGAEFLSCLWTSYSWRGLIFLLGRVSWAFPQLGTGTHTHTHTLPDA